MYKIRKNQDNLKVIDEINTFLNDKESEQLLLVGPDPVVIEKAVRKILKEFKYDYEVVQVLSKKETNGDNKIFLLDITLSTSMQYQSVLYHYLELVNKCACILILTSTSVQCINTFEKRVKSRFKNKIFMLGYDKKVIDEEGEEKEKENNSNNADNANNANIFVENNLCNKSTNNKVTFMQCKSTLQEEKAFDFMKKYELQQYSIDFVCELFEPLHFVIMIILFKRKSKIKQNQIYEIFREFNVRELNKSDENDVLYAYYDLLEFGWISNMGEVMVDIEEFKLSVEKRCALYIQKLLN